MPPDDLHFEAFGYAEVARVLNVTVDAAPPEKALALRRGRGARAGEGQRHAVDLRFVPAGWMGIADLNACASGDWMRSCRSLLFEVKTYNQEPYASRVNVALIVCPAPQAIRAKLYDGARERPGVFVGIVKPMDAKWATIFARELLGAAAGRDMSHEDRAVAVNAAWADFLANDLPSLEGAVADILAG